MILNEFGNPYVYENRLAHAANRLRTRGPQFAVQRGDIDKLIPTSDRFTLAALSERLYVNFGVLKAVVNQRASFSVGDAYLPDYVGESDMEDGKAIAKFLTKYWFPSCTVEGGILQWNELLRLTSATVDVYGDAFWMMVKGADGMPRIQCIPPHRIRSGSYVDEGKVTDGKWKGYSIRDGIIRYSSSRVAAYRVQKDDDTFEDIPASDMIHGFDLLFAKQGRGLPLFTHALEDFKTALCSIDDERIRQQIISRMHLSITNEIGGPEIDDPKYQMTQAQDGEPGFVAKYHPGGIVYMSAGAGEKIEQIKHESPGPLYESFQDRLFKAGIVGADWVYSLVWNSPGQGTAERAEIMKARRAIIARQRLLDFFARRAISWAYAVFHEQGRVPLLDHPFAWKFSRPSRLSVDDGRESKMELEEWRAGLRNTDEITEARGMTDDEFHERRARIIWKRKYTARRVAEELNALHGQEITVEDREMAMLTPNDMAAQVPANTPEEPEPNEDDEDPND
jgi:capsid protein